MTAEEWDASTSLRELLADCGLPDGDRRLRLFSAACARRVAAVMPDDRARGLVDLAEARADGGLSDGDWLRAVFETVDPYIGNEAARDRAGGATFGVLLRLHQTDTDSILRLAESVVEARAYLAYTGGYSVAVGADEWVRRAVEAETLELCRLFRCLCGCPSRRPRFAPQWRTDTAVSLARQMYDSRDFGARRSSRMRSRTRAVTTPTPSPTAGRPARTLAGAGSWTWWGARVAWRPPTLPPCSNRRRGSCSCPD